MKKRKRKKTTGTRRRSGSSLSRRSPLDRRHISVLQLASTVTITPAVKNSGRATGRVAPVSGGGGGGVTVSSWLQMGDCIQRHSRGRFHS